MFSAGCLLSSSSLDGLVRSELCARGEQCYPQIKILAGKQKSEQGDIGRPCREDSRKEACIFQDIKLARSGRGLYEAIGVSEGTEWPSLGDLMFASSWRTPEPPDVHHLRLMTWRGNSVLNACSMGITVPAAWCLIRNRQPSMGGRCRSSDVPSSIPQYHGSYQILPWCFDEYRVLNSIVPRSPPLYSIP
jgi:hypothetical protein